jgi:hypothetical protein
LTLYIPAMSPSTDSLSIQAFSAISRCSLPPWLFGFWADFSRLTPPVWGIGMDTPVGLEWQE